MGLDLKRFHLCASASPTKFNVGLKTLLHQGLSEPEFYGDLVYKLKKIVGRADFSDPFRKIIVRYKRWLVVLRLNVPVNNFSVMSGRSHRFLGN